MRFFNFSRKKDYTPAAAVQTASSSKINHPFLAISQYNPLSETQMRLYSSIREAIPIIDAAILKLVRLIGSFRVVCDDKYTEREINKFLDEVQVGASQQGIDRFIASYLDQLLTYGTAIGEIVPNANNTDIAALYNASLNDVELGVSESPINLKIQRKDCYGEDENLECPELVLVSSLNPKPGDVYGTSILKGLPFVSDILLKIYNSIGLNWDRVGNVRFAVTYNPGSDPNAMSYAKERASQIASEWQRAMQNSEGVSDFVAVGDVNIKVIGADNQILDSNIPAKQMLEQIIAKLSVPPFLLGLSWSTTERMSTQQADILTSELEAYRRLLNPIISKICSMWMRFNGRVTDYQIDWDFVNLQDEVEIAKARLFSARALEIEKKLQSEI